MFLGLLSRVFAGLREFQFTISQIKDSKSKYIKSEQNVLKGSLDAKFTLSSLNINVLDMRVHIHPIMIKIHPVFIFKSLF